MFGTELFLGPLAATFLIGITTILLLYWVGTKNHDYWKKRGIVHVKPLPFFGTILDSFKMPLHDMEEDRYKRYGKIYGHYEGNNALLSVADPTLLREILVKDFQHFTGRRDFKTGDRIVDSMVSLLQGEDWKRVRSIITPTFSTGKIKRMLSIFRDCSKTLSQNFRKAAEKGECIDAKRLYGTFTMDIIASSAFSTKIDSHNNPDNPFVETARVAFRQSVTWRFVTFIVFPRIMKLLRIPLFAPKVMNFFKDATFQIMEERRKTGQVRNDFLQLLMDTAKEVSDEENWDSPDKEDITTNYGDVNAEQQILKYVTKKHLSMDELVAQCVIFFLAGYDTTASTLSFATYLLALNPDIQDKLRQEVDEALKENNGELTYEAIQSMKYLDNVISETLRLYPPAIRLERLTEMDYKLGDTGITVEKGTIVSIPVYGMHRDPEIYPDPLRFDPNRFTPEERSKRDQYAYLPFGAGPRNCVGMRFALLEIKVCLAEVIANFRVKRSPKTKVPLDFLTGPQGLLQPKEIFLDLEIRKDSPPSK